MKRLTCILFVAGAITIFANHAEAQNRGNRGGRGGGDPAEFIERMFENDENSDGKLSAAELGDRGARMIDRADSNSDGFLSKDEITEMMESRRGGRGQQGEAGGREGGRGQRGEAGGREGGTGRGQGGGINRLLEMIPLMKALDKDGNGELSEKEIDNAVKALKSLDKDKDGKISTKELMPEAPQFDRGRRGPGGAGGERRGRPRRPEFDDSDGLTKGQTAPDFELKSLDGKSNTKLSELFAAKPVVLFFGSYT